MRWPRPVIRTELWITETEDFFQIDTLYSDDTFLICTRFLFQVSAHPLCQCCFFFKKVVIISSIYHGCEVFASGWMEDLCYIVVSKWDYSAETHWCIFADHDKDGHLWCLCCRLIPSLLYIPAEITHTAEVMFSSFLTAFFKKRRLLEVKGILLKGVNLHNCSTWPYCHWVLINIMFLNVCLS